MESDERRKKETHKWAGKTVILGDNSSLVNVQGDFRNMEYQLEDWAENVLGESWIDQEYQNFGCIHYSIRVKNSILPKDDNVVYGKIGLLGHLIHVTELQEVKK